MPVKTKKKSKQEKTIARVVRKELHRNVEDKFRQSNVGEFTYVSNPSLAGPDTWGVQNHLLNGIVQGTSAGQRVGNMIHLRHIWIRGVIRAGSVNSSLRVMLYYCKVQDLQRMIPAELLTSLDATNGSMAPHNPNFIPLSAQVLYDKIFPLNIFGGSAQIAEIKSFNINLNLKNRITRYDNTNSGTVADIEQGGLFLCAFSDVNEADPVGNRPLMRFVGLLRYEDA